MSKPFDKIRIHISGFMPLDYIIENWSDEDKEKIQNYDEEAWERMWEMCNDQIGDWVMSGTLTLDVDPVDY